jgi:hypothetical protein
LTRAQAESAIDFLDQRIAANKDALARLESVLVDYPESVWHDDITLGEAVLADLERTKQKRTE